jgi:GTP-binding protein
VRFVDEVIITVKSGDGGRGCVSFRRERFIPRGGPDGGDGGKGGDVILKTTLRKRTLNHFKFKRDFKAKNGSPGQGQQKSGKNGDDLILEVPPGTVVSNADSAELIRDLAGSDEFYIVAKGGRGGRGNTRFKSSTNRAPRYAQPGEMGQALTLKLELKLLADVGLVGLPNAGKSTLIKAISAAQPKIDSYPFTTLTPNLGVVQSSWGEPFVVADIPGLIEGAHQGAGLGIRFLKHIERTRILVHLIDAATIDPDQPLCQYQTINNELAAYSPRLAEKPQLVVLTKLDLPEARQRAPLLASALAPRQVWTISAQCGEGLDHLKSQIQHMLDETPLPRFHGC